MPDLSRFIPSIDLAAHNAVALLIALIVAFVLSELLVRLLLRIAGAIYSSKVIASASDDDRQLMRKRVRRRSLLVLALITLALIAASAALTFGGYRALDFFKSWLAELTKSNTASNIKAGAPIALGIALAALLANAVARVIITGLSNPLSKPKWLQKHKETIAKLLQRLRIAITALIFWSAVVLIAKTLGLPQGFQSAMQVLAYIACALGVSHLLVATGYLLVDGTTDFWTYAAESEGPLRYAHKLNHLTGVTKRVIDYLIFVGATIWVAEQLSPDTWIGQAGRVAVRIISIAYISRLVVEICILLLREIFIENTDKENQAALQQRQTLVPVAIGLVRYGIYFSALVMILRTMDIDPTPLLAGAGVIGVAIGLGAQAFVGDLVAGFFILFENLLLVGDIVEIGGVKGKVEEIGVRITKVRDDDTGVLYAIPNGEVRKVANHSKVFVNALVDVYIPYEEDLQRVQDLLIGPIERVMEEKIGKKPSMEVKLQELTEGSMLLRVQVQVPPGMDDEMGGLIRSCVVKELKAAGIGAPRPRRAVIIDSRLEIHSPEGGLGEDGEDEGPPKAFEAPAASD